MKQYPKYKDSGIQWIGQIPEGWKVGRLKDISAFINGYAFNSNTFSKEKGKRVIRIGDIGSTIDYVNCIRTTEQNDALELYKIHENDILIAMSGATTGKSCLAVNVEEAYINQRVGIIRSEHYGYISYILQMPYLYEYISLNDAGSAQPNVSGKSIGNLPVPLPPISEQESIVRYLDDKTAKIDETVNLLEQQKTDLQQYRKALISKTVTRGLNPNAKLKESGISWIGQIPEGWEISPLKYISKIQTGSTPSTSESRYYGEEFNWFTPGDFKGNFVLDDSSRKLSSYAVSEKACRLFPANSIYLIGIGGTLGKIAICEAVASANQQITVISPNDTMVCKFLAYFLSTKRRSFELMANAATLPILSNVSVSNFIIPLPPISEQQAIADFLDSKTATIDQSIANIETQIADLRAYRATLISDVVTGKFDVRN